LYVYDAQTIIQKIDLLKEAMAGLNTRIKYAAKSLTNLSILKLMKSQGIGLDVVSIQEAHLGLKAGFAPSEILYTPNCVSIEEFKEAVDLGLLINIDNISILEQFGHLYGDSVPVCIRLNPHLLGGGNSKIQVGHIDSKFGISILQMRLIHRVVKTYGLHVIGLHVHTGSDILDSEVFLRGADVIFEAAAEFPDLQFIDFGSGFKVAYREGDITTDVRDLGQKLRVAFQKFSQSYGRELEVWFEPGKFLVSESGLFLVKANVIKQTPATVFVGVDSGLNHLIRPMMYDAYHEILNISNPKGALRLYSIVGYICETDTFGADRKLNEVKEGDILAIKNAGAYGFSMASNYNSRFRPAEVMVYDGQAHLIRQRETLEDILRHQVDTNLDFSEEVIKNLSPSE
ncbi:MAG: diaminopimelate decarboxylase, partial [Bacteroidota bacterium]